MSHLKLKRISPKVLGSTPVLYKKTIFIITVVNFSLGNFYLDFFSLYANFYTTSFSSYNYPTEGS